MSKRSKFIANLGLYGLAAGLLAYAASRTLDFVQNTMPADRAVWGYLFLLSTGGGALIWLMVYLSKAEGAKQRGLAFVMGIIDLAGELVMVYADTVRVSSEKGLLSMTQTELSTFITASVAIVGANIAAVYAFHLFDPKAERDSQARDLVDDVTEATMKALNTPEAKQEMIGQLSPVLRDAVISDVTQQVNAAAGMFGKRLSLADSLFDRALQRKTGKEKPGFFDMFKPQKETRFNADQGTSVVWTETPEGKRQRVFCLICRDQGKPWRTSEPCEHILNAQGERVLLKAQAENLQSLAIDGKAFKELLDNLANDTDAADTGTAES
jgi:hypothetical protein